MGYQSTGLASCRVIYLFSFISRLPGSSKFLLSQFCAGHHFLVNPFTLFLKAQIFWSFFSGATVPRGLNGLLWLKRGTSLSILLISFKQDPFIVSRNKNLFFRQALSLN
jgi:hypothetical protein